LDRRSVISRLVAVGSLVVLPARAQGQGKTVRIGFLSPVEQTYQVAFYESLRQLNPSPYMYYLDFGMRRVIGASPEMLLRVEDRTATTFPIAGTRPLGTTLPPLKS